jgi:hypothetical protein
MFGTNLAVLKRKRFPLHTLQMIAVFQRSIAQTGHSSRRGSMTASPSESEHPSRYFNLLVQQRDYFRARPNVVRNARFHRRSDPERRANTAEIVIHKMNRNPMTKIGHLRRAANLFGKYGGC